MGRPVTVHEAASSALVTLAAQTCYHLPDREGHKQVELKSCQPIDSLWAATNNALNNKAYFLPKRGSAATTQGTHPHLERFG